MFRIFTVNSPFNIILCAIVFLALQVSWWAQSQQQVLIVNYTEPLSNLLFTPIQLLSNSKSILQSVGFVLAFAIAIWLNATITSNKILQSRTYTTAILFLLLLSLVNNFATLLPQLVALFFALRILQKSLTIIKDEKPFGDIFDLGWLSSLATLFYFPAIWLFPFSLMALVILRPFSLREWLMAATGFIAPLFLVFAIYFWFDKTHELVYNLINLPNTTPFNFSFTASTIVAAITLAVLFLLSTSALPRILFSNAIQIRKFSMLLLLMVALTLLSALFQSSFQIWHFSMLCLPLSILCAMYFQSLKGIFISELLFGMLILSAVFVHFFK